MSNSAVSGAGLVQVGPAISAAMALIPPDLTEYVAVNKTTVAAGGTLTIDAYDMNIGNGVSGPSTAQIYLSTDPTITTSDTVLATLTTPEMLATVSQPGYYDHQTVSVTLPGNLAPGTYYIGGIANYNNQISESNTTNNTYDVVQITVTSPPQPDLSEYVAVSNTTVAAGGSVTIDAYDMNLGNGVSGPSTAQIYLSTDSDHHHVRHGARNPDDVADAGNGQPARLLRPPDGLGGAPRQSRARYLLHRWDRQLQ